jgi:fructan beta-fructosidase
MKNILLCAIAMLCMNHLTAYAGDVRIKIEKRYLNLPVSQQSERQRMTFDVDGKQDRTFVIRLSAEPEYWVFCDMSAYRGKTVTIRYEGDDAGLKRIYQDEMIAGADSLYRETNRPQLHFTSRRGWNNDPNGLLFYDGEYHLFYQHNPYEREWENMHWGHAVSTDLVHWSELNDALYPDALGTAFSGSAVIDYDNTSGFGKSGAPAMVAIYTAAGTDRQVQCVAYSLDKGRTWIKYAQNPVIDSKEKWNSQDTRDPKVFWYAPGGHWVMVLNERDGHSIYTSADLKKWTYESHTAGFWECPELFELPVNGDKRNTLWVMYGASGTYMLGHFDGKKYTPVSGKHYFGNGAIYAAQTFTNIPEADGRRIQIGWHRIDNPGMPFQSQMGLPTELMLKTTPNGVRLFNRPVKEVDVLQGAAAVSAKDLTAEQANDMLHIYNGTRELRVRAVIKLSHATGAGLSLNGQNLIDYDMNYNQLNGAFYSPADMTSLELAADIIIDRTSVEVFVDNGAFSYCLQRSPRDGNTEGFRFWGNRIEIKSLEVYPMQSIWK